MTHYVLKGNHGVVYAGVEWMQVVRNLPREPLDEFNLTCIEEKDGNANFTYLTGVWLDARDIKFRNKQEERLPLRLTKN